MTMRDQFRQTLGELMDADPRVHVLLADIGTADLADLLRRHPLRAINLGIMEQSLVSFAAGIALEGGIPVAHSIAPFLIERAYEQIKDDLCYQGVGANLVSNGASYDYSPDGMTHHCPGDVPILSVLPRMQVVVPGTAREFDRLFRQAYGNGSPTYFRLSVSEHSSEVDAEFGQVAVLRTGSRGAILSVGPLLDACRPAADELDLSLIHCATVVPFDGVGFAAAVPAPAVLVVEPYYAGVLTPAVMSAFGSAPVRVRSHGVPREVLSRYGQPEQHSEALGLTPAGVLEVAREFFGAVD